MSKSLKIGIPASNIGGIIGVREDMVKFVSQFGEVELLTYYKPVDAIVLPGGSDVDPFRYGESPWWWTYPPSMMLERFDTHILPHYLGKIPVIGICRGLQTLNVQYGGSLHQHLFLEKQSTHGMDLVHKIMTDTDDFMVNSFHHQGIKKLAHGFKAIAKHSGLLIEAIENVGEKVFAVQWHPERMIDRNVYTDFWTINKIKELIK